MKESTRDCTVLTALLLLLASLGLSEAWLAAAAQAPQAAAEQVQTKTNPKDGAEMVSVPAGPFKMGVDAAPLDSEQRPQVNLPKHEVTLDAYWIYKYPVTVKQYRAYCDATGTKMPPEPLWGWKDDHPMVNVSWEDADKYAKWAGAALPTEAQWEKAARGTDERLFPWGKDWDPKRCVHSDKVWGDRKSTEPVGSCPSGASPCGAMDMAGNVWEWCGDWFKEDYYKDSPASNPPGQPQRWEIPAHQDAAGKDVPAETKYSLDRVVRGGAWCLCDPKDFQTVNRDWSRVPALWSMDLGFRCVVTGK